MRVRAQLPQIHRYDVFTASSADVVRAAEALLPDNWLRSPGWRAIEREDITGIDSGREGYGPMALSYLSQGHKGIGIFVGDDLAALGWYIRNDGRFCRRYGYYPLRQGAVWLHADWVAPAYRGRGLHQLLIAYRALLTQQRYGDTPLEANVDPQAAPASGHNYRKLGFVRTARLGVLRWHRPLIVWKRGAEQDVQ